MAHRVCFIILLALLACCTDKPEVKILTNEREQLIDLVTRTSRELFDLGFAIDASLIEIEVMSASEMAAKFNEIDDQSRPEMEDFIATPGLKAKGKKALFHDGANARLAFYDPNTKTIIFQSGALKELSKGHLAHELTHAYQDQKWGYDHLWNPYQEKPSRELYNVINFALEGHAELARHAYEQAFSETSQEKSNLAWGLGKLFDTNCVMCSLKGEASQIPYSVGMHFFLHQYQEGGWSLVEKYMSSLPLSTEQMLHPQKCGRDIPTPVDLPLWEPDNLQVRQVAEGSMGEAFLLAKLLALPMNPLEAYMASSGWDGDVAHVYKNEEGKEVLLWRLLFDRDQDATQLERSVSKLGMSKNVMKRGRSVDWIITDNEELLKTSRIFMSKNTMRRGSPDAHDELTTAAQEKSFLSASAKASFYPSMKIYIKPLL